jgi:transposase
VGRGDTPLTGWFTGGIGRIRRLALALREAARALKANRAQLQTIVNDLAPGFTDRPGLGPISAAQAIVSFSHPGRCRNDAAFATLGGASPLEASSGRTVRHRLNRGGDRALNRALHTIATTRMRSCPTTQAYVARRTAEGKNPRETRVSQSLLIMFRLRPRLRGRLGFLAGWPAQGMGCEISRR